MDFAILEQPIQKEIGVPTYRGLERTEPPHPPETSKVPKLWTWYASFGDDHLHDKKMAIEFIKQYEFLCKDKDYDLVRIERKFELGHNDKFLGIDVASSGGYSAVKSGLLYWCTGLSPERRPSLIELCCWHFKPRLNQNLLFEDASDAELFGRVVKDIQTLEIGYIEPDFDYYPQFLYLVETKSETA